MTPVATSRTPEGNEHEAQRASSYDAIVPIYTRGLLSHDSQRNHENGETPGRVGGPLSGAHLANPGPRFIAESP